MFKIEFNLQNIPRIIGFLVLGLILFLMRDVFWLLFIAFIFTSALNPLLHLLENHKIPRTAAALMILFVFIMIVMAFGFILIPTITQQFGRILQVLPSVLNQDIYNKAGLDHWFSYDQFSKIYQQSIDSLINWLRTASFSLLELGIGLLGAFISAITITVLSFYMLLDHDKIVGFLVDLLPEKARYHSKALILKTETKLGTWMRGQIMVMLIMAMITYLGLIIVGVPSALALALLAGLFEIVPFVGPSLTSIPAILVASSLSSYHVLGVMFLFFILQQIEGNIIVPKVMNRAVGLHPIVVILAVTVGAQQGGPLGALLAIPMSTVAYIFFKEWQERRKI